jgi:hypothetical protein
MSGRTTGCCNGISSLTDVFILPPNVCKINTLNCKDAISIVIQAILNLKQSQGSSALSIYNEALGLCTNVTMKDINDALTLGAKRGIFFRVIPTVGAEPTFMIVARMPVFNYQNRLYNRLPCQPNGFWIVADPVQ